jgi:hypothetical protein
VKFACPCCGHLTLNELGANDICPVCFWEDDGQADERADEVWGGPNYELSLTQARTNFKTFGACAEKYIVKVRAPFSDEVPA